MQVLFNSNILSMVDKDTSNADVKLASCEYYAHVLLAYADPELKAVLQVATGREKFSNSSVISNYKEIQIHGPVVRMKYCKVMFRN